MIRSEEIKNISAALALFHKEVTNINRDRQGYGYKYAALPNVLEAIKEPLEKAGLVISQFPVGEYELTTILVHIKTGEFFQTTSKIDPLKRDPQGLGSGLTYLRRYHIIAILSLNVEDDDDGAYASGKSGDNEKKSSNKSTPKEAPSVDDEKPWLNEKDPLFEVALEKLSKGETTIDKIKESFKLSRIIKTKLEEAVAKSS